MCLWRDTRSCFDCWQQTIGWRNLWLCWHQARPWWIVSLGLWSWWQRLVFPGALDVGGCLPRIWWHRLVSPGVRDVQRLLLLPGVLDAGAWWPRLHPRIGGIFWPRLHPLPRPIFLPRFLPTVPAFLFLPTGCAPFFLLFLFVCCAPLFLLFLFFVFFFFFFLLLLLLLMPCGIVHNTLDALQRLLLRL